MKNSPYLDKPRRTEAEARAEIVECDHCVYPGGGCKGRCARYGGQVKRIAQEKDSQT